MRQATTGDTVRVHYTGTLADGTVFDSSAEGEPIEVTIGNGDIISGFETALLGMAEGETRNVTLEPEDAYGPHNAKLVHVVERARIPDEVQLDVGTILRASGDGDNPVRLVVVELDDENVTLDANHPLAGKPLTFELRLIDFLA